jgi:hypothetical protein
VLADDARHRAVPIWMQAEPGDSGLSQILELTARPAGEIVMADAPEELTARLLHAAGASVTGVDIEVTAADVDELSPQVTLPAQRPRFEPRNLSFTDGLDRWDLDRGSRHQADEDYSADADGQTAILSSTVPRPPGSAALVQVIFADDYRGATVVFGGEIRTGPRTEQAGLRLEIRRHPWRGGPARENHGVTISGDLDWTRQEITARIPEDADMILFGIILAGPGRIELRHPELRHPELRHPELRHPELRHPELRHP